VVLGLHAERALGAWARLGMYRVTVVWELRENLSAYDATYVTVAETLETPLLTADARLARAPGPNLPDHRRPQLRATTLNGHCARRSFG
jgi:predicted nucleic acid-binding protein